MAYEPFLVVDVELDLANPRFADPVNGQPEAINALLLQGPSKLLNLAEDIAVTGELDPINPPLVMRTADGPVVLEGNRRFAALKLLRNPDLAQAEATRKSLRSIKARAVKAGKPTDGPSEVVCYVVKSREEAQRWIELRHTGQNDGVGTDPWNTYQSASFRPRATAEYRAVLFVQKVLATFADDADLVSDVRTVRDGGKFTNLARLIGRPYVRDQMSVSIKSNQVTLDSDNDFATDVLKVVMADLTTIVVDEIKTGEQQDDYIDKVVAAVSERYVDGTHGEGDDPNPSPDNDGDSEEQSPDEDSQADSGDGTNGSNGGHGTGSGGGSPGGGSNSGGSAAGEDSGESKSPGRRRNAPRGESRIFYGLTLRNVDLRTSKLLKEAQKIKIDDAPGVCAVMVRIILEMATTDIGVRFSWFKEGASLRDKFKKALKALDPDIEHSLKRDKALAMAWIKSQTGDGDGLAVDEMNAYVHNFMASPTAESVRALTAIFRPMLQRLDDYAGENQPA